MDTIYTCPNITRRSILRGLFATPAIVAASSLMPIRGVAQPLYDNTGILPLYDNTGVIPLYDNTGTWVALGNDPGILETRYYTRVLSKEEIGQLFRALAEAKVSIADGLRPSQTLPSNVRTLRCNPHLRLRAPSNRG